MTISNVVFIQLHNQSIYLFLAPYPTGEKHF